MPPIAAETGHSILKKELLLASSKDQLEAVLTGVRHLLPLPPEQQPNLLVAGLIFDPLKDCVEIRRPLSKTGGEIATAIHLVVSKETLTEILAKGVSEDSNDFYAIGRPYAGESLEFFPLEKALNSYCQINWDCLGEKTRSYRDGRFPQAESLRKPQYGSWFSRREGAFLRFSSPVTLDHLAKKIDSMTSPLGILAASDGFQAAYGI
jgi:hypothetical protein